MSKILEFAQKNKLKHINLHLGCGGHYLNNWINIDFYEYEKNDTSRNGLKCDIFMNIKTLDAPENSIDNIMLIHVIEHFTRWESIKLFQNFYNILKKEGCLIIEQPDLDGCINWYLNSKKTIKTPIGNLNMGRTQFYGNQWDELDYETHRYLWTKDEIANELKKVGFKIIRIDNNTKYHCSGRDMHVTVIK